MQSAGIKKKTELWILIPHCWTWGCWASAGRLIEWIMNRLLTSLVLKVSLVLSEVPACRGWPWQRSGASSIVWDKKAALLGLSSSTPCRLPCRNTYKYIVRRWRGVWPLSSMVSPFTLTCTNCPSGPVTQRSWHLLLYGCSLSYWDCVIQAKEDRGVPPPPTFWNARLLPITSQPHCHAHELQAEARGWFTLITLQLQSLFFMCTCRSKKNV